MSSQSDRVDTILRQLHEAEGARRFASASGPEPDASLHSELAEQIRTQVGLISAADLRSVVLRMVVDGVNGGKWSRCGECGRPNYLGEANSAVAR